MNKEMLVVMKWLDNLTLITQEELEEAHTRAVAAEDKANLIADELEDVGGEEFETAVSQTDSAYCVKRATRVATKGWHTEANKWVDTYFSVCSDITRQTYINCIKFGSSNVPEA